MVIIYFLTMLGYIMLSTAVKAAIRRNKHWRLVGFPCEHRLSRWLQERAMARALGVDLEIIQLRRKIETADKPIHFRKN